MTDETAKKKFCSGCKWHSYFGDYNCVAPHIPISLVTGISEHVLCSIERSVDGKYGYGDRPRCGPEGRFWEKA